MGASGGGIMNPRRFATMAASFCGTVVLASWVIACLAGFGSAGIENTGAVPIGDRRAPALGADAELADVPQATIMGNAPVVASADVATAAISVTATATGTTAASHEPEPIVEAALPDSSQMLPAETPPVQVTTTSAP